MKRFLLLLLLMPVVAFAQRNNAYLAYIDKYNELAVKQQQEHGIPASITLAQGILESGAGQGRLAVRANNHFGIKCHDDWHGARIYHNDDRRRECFRRYRRVLDSYEDHSKFLKNRSRYASLFELDPTDYKGWAHGLKKAGYATDPAYAYKLIALIDEYELHRFDLTTTRDNRRKSRKNWLTRGRTTSATSLAKRSEPVQEPVEMTPSPSGKVVAYTPHSTQRLNGLRYIVARPGDTYGSIADEFGLSAKNVAKYNEMPPEAKPAPGERVYLQQKKRKAPRQFTTHVVQPGESLYSIAQYYGIRLIALYDLNGLSYDAKAQVGQVLKLR